MAFSFLWMAGNLKGEVPFLSSPGMVLKEIEKALEIKDDSIVYDLGCGDGRVLFYLSRSNKKAKYIGIENNPFPLFLVKIMSIFKNNKDIDVKIVNNDFFKQDISEATHVFLYLLPKKMDKLLPKFEKELKPGTRIVSLSFPFMDKTPTKTIDLKRGKYKLGRNIYVYQF